VLIENTASQSWRVFIETQCIIYQVTENFLKQFSINQSISLIATLRPESRIANAVEIIHKNSKRNQQCAYMYIGAGRDVHSGLWLMSHCVGWLVMVYRPKFMNERYFFVRKVGLGKEVVSLSLVVTDVSRAGGMRWWRQEVGLHISWKKILKGYYV